VNGRLLTTRELAERLGISPETVLRWIQTRGLPARRLTSRAIRYDEAELDAWLDERATGAADRGVSNTQADRTRNGDYAALPLRFPSSNTPPVRRATTEEDS
jgi:excisionase family DNA binding protein